MMRFKKVILLGASLYLALSLGACGSQPTSNTEDSTEPVKQETAKDTIKDEKTFEFVTEDGQPPVQFSENGKVTGIAYDVLNQAFEKMGYKINVQSVPWTRALDMCKNGEADGVFSAYYKPERAEYGTYSKEALIDENTSFFTLKDSNVKYDGVLENLSNVTIGMTNGYSGGEKFDALVKAGKLKVDYSEDATVSINKLLDKKVDIILNSKYTILDVLKKMDKLDATKELTPSLDKASSFLVFSKKKNIDPAIISKLDETIASMKSDGSYQKIIDKYIK